MSSRLLELPNKNEMYWMVISSPFLMPQLALIVILFSGSTLYLDRDNAKNGTRIVKSNLALAMHEWDRNEKVG